MKTLTGIMLIALANLSALYTHITEKDSIVEVVWWATAIVCFLWWSIVLITVYVNSLDE